MFLNTVADRNPALIRAATALHQGGAIPANTYVVDRETVRDNARGMVLRAGEVGLSLYFMTKHFNRNPLVSHSVVAAGIPAAVAVDVQDAQALARYGVPVGHVGHLVQIPKHSLRVVLALRPEIMTIFGVDKARQVSEVAMGMGLVQDIQLRVRGTEDIIYPNEEGGVWEHELEDTAREIEKMAGVRLVGVVSFPATLYNPKTNRLEATVNFDTLRRTRDRLTGLGFEIKQVNAAGSSSTLGFETVVRNGGTHAEPGHALTGMTPWHFCDQTTPERPAIVYVSEVSHLFDGKAYVFGGGFYACDTPADVGDDTRYRVGPWEPRAFVGRTPDDILDTSVPVDVNSFFGRTLNATDYYGGTLCPDQPTDIRVGDTAVYGFRPQAFTTRSHVAVLDGVDSIPRLLGLFDRAGNLLDEDGYPVENSVSRVRELVADLT